MLKKFKAYWEKYPDRTAAAVIFSIFAVLVSATMIIMHKGIVWGSNTDWKSQHFPIPEYFRMRFYETHDIFPDFALQLGSGQNIYNFGYYGIANPLYLPAYALPFVPMSIYIEVLSLSTVIVSALMSYKFFKGHFSRKISLVLAIMFLCSGGIFYHSHCQIMFMNYFPFLLAMLFVCRKKDSIINTFIMMILAYCIMCCSFYFCIGSFAAVGLYMVYLEIEKNGKFSLKSAWLSCWRKIAGAALGCLISAHFLLPTLSAIFSGRDETNQKSALWKILIPQINFTTILYSGYSLGFTAVGVIGAIYLLKNGRIQDRFLSASLLCCAVFPIINYIFNAGMYIDGKVFIPLMPVMLLICGAFLSSEKLIKKDIKISLIIYAVMIGISVFYITTKKYFILIYICECVLAAVLILLLMKKKKAYLLQYYCVAVSLIVCISNGCADDFISSSQLRNFYKNDTKKEVAGVLDSDTELYRFSDCIPDDIYVNRIFSMEYLSTNSYSSVNNSYFREFRLKHSLSENRVRNTAVQNQPYSVVFNSLMGCRYRIAPADKRMYGEEIVSDSGEYAVFKNNYALPLGYASSDLMSEEKFYALSDENKAEALLKNIIVPEKNAEGIIPHLTETLEADMTGLANDPHITYENETYTIKADDQFELSIGLDEPVKDKLIIVLAKADNRIGNRSQQRDVSLTINGVKNKLTNPNWKYNNKNYDFTYVISSYDPIERLDMIFTKGFYSISDIRIFTLEASVLDSAMDNKDALEINRSESLGDTISGKINVTSDGWFNMSLPYDKGFNITVDGNDTEYFKTNTAFIGFPISSGEHEIRIEYEAPMKKEGIAVSITAAALAVVFLLTLSINKNKRKDN